MVICPGPYPWYQFLHSVVTIQSLSASRYIPSSSSCGQSSSTYFFGFSFSSAENISKETGRLTELETGLRAKSDNVLATDLLVGDVLGSGRLDQKTIVGLQI